MQTGRVPCPASNRVEARRLVVTAEGALIVEMPDLGPRLPPDRAVMLGPRDDIKRVVEAVLQNVGQRSDGSLGPQRPVRMHARRPLLRRFVSGGKSTAEVMLRSRCDIVAST